MFIILYIFVPTIWIVKRNLNICWTYKTVAGAGIIGIILKDVASNQKYIFVGGLVVVFIVLVMMAFKISKKQ